jgi:hypothetical protein
VEIAMASLPLHLHHHRGVPMPVARARKAAPGLLGRMLQTLRLWHRRVTERDALSRLTDRDLRNTGSARHAHFALRRRRRGPQTVLARLTCAAAGGPGAARLGAA